MRCKKGSRGRTPSFCVSFPKHVEAVKCLLSAIQGNDLINIQVKRLGNNSSAQGPRPLLARLSSHSDVRKTLRFRSNIQSDISILTDKTPLQREQLKKLMDEVSYHSRSDVSENHQICGRSSGNHRPASLR